MFNGAEFNVNVSKRTLEDLQPYFEQYVAWSMDGKQILAHEADLNDLYKLLDSRGLLKDSVIDFIPSGAFSFDASFPSLWDADIVFDNVSFKENIIV
jgi:hypothetical protein